MSRVFDTNQSIGEYRIVDFIGAGGMGEVYRAMHSKSGRSAGQVKLLDFGIAKGQMSPGLTQVGSVVGTLQYLAPELIRGGASDERGDIWALGVLLYEMVTGRMPFEAQTVGDLSDKIGRASYPSPSQYISG